MSDLLREAIDRERAWLQLQGEFQPWESGCRWVSQEITDWLDQEVELRPASPAVVPWVNGCSIRVWNVWAYHWREAALVANGNRTSGKLVVEQLRGGVRPGIAGPAAMGGDPLRDAVIVEAFLCGVKPAYEHIRQLYDQVFLGEKSRLGLSSADLLYERVWDLIYSVDRAPTQLGQFNGFSSLKTYMRLLVHHRLIDCIRKEAAQRLAEIQAYHIRNRQLDYNGALEIELDEFRAQVVSAMRSLSEPEQDLLVLKYSRGLSNRIAAQAIGLSEGYVSRLHNQAIDKLRTMLGAYGADIERKVDFDFSIYAGSLLRGIQMAVKQKIQKGELRETMGRVASPVKRELAHQSANLEQRRELEIANESRINKGNDMDCSKDLDRMPYKLVELVEKPEVVFAGLRAAGRNCPHCLLIDARRADANAIFDWQQRLDSLLMEQDEQAIDYPVDIHRVFFVATSFDESQFECWVDRPDVDWYLTDELHGELPRFYQHQVNRIWGTIIGSNISERLDRDAGPDVVSVIELHSSPEDAAWQKRLLEMQAESE